VLNGPRGWNEFDDDPDRQRDEPFMIYIDPDAPSTFPGAETFAHISSAITYPFQRLISLITGNPTPEDKINPERNPLLDDYLRRRPTTEDAGGPDSNDSDDSLLTSPTARAFQPRANNSQRNSRASYSTFRPQSLPITSPSHHRALANLTKLLSIFCAVSLIASAGFLAMAWGMEFVRRKRYKSQVEIGSIIGVVASFSFALVGVLVAGRIGRLEEHEEAGKRISWAPGGGRYHLGVWVWGVGSWVGRGVLGWCVGVVFSGLVVGNGFLLVWML
jgi:hypothetical protein